MNSFSSTILLPALRTLLANTLQKAVQLQCNIFRPPSETYLKAISSQQGKFLPSDIPLTRARNVAHICYTSAIALKLANLSGMPATKIATSLRMSVSTVIEGANNRNDYLSLDRVWTEFSVEASETGWIVFQLSPKGLAAWLQHLTSQPLRLSSDKVSAKNDKNNYQNLCNSTSLFVNQYIHARCCTLLRQAEQDDLVALNTPDYSISGAEKIIAAPHPLPWLSPDNTLRLHHPDEVALITQLVTTLDDLVCLSERRSNNSVACLAYKLSQRFQAFYATCRIWGDVKTDMPELSQARLGLVLATQSILRLLLEDALGVAAPVEL